MQGCMYIPSSSSLNVLRYCELSQQLWTLLWGFVGYAEWPVEGVQKMGTIILRIPHFLGVHILVPIIDSIFIVHIQAQPQEAHPLTKALCDGHVTLP